MKYTDFTAYIYVVLSLDEHYSYAPTHTHAHAGFPSHLGISNTPTASLQRDAVSVSWISPKNI